MAWLIGPECPCSMPNACVQLYGESFSAGVASAGHRDAETKKLGERFDQIKSDLIILGTPSAKANSNLSVQSWPWSVVARVPFFQVQCSKIRKAKGLSCSGSD